MIESQSFSQEDIKQFISWVTDERFLLQFAGPQYKIDSLQEQLLSEALMIGDRDIDILVAKNSEIDGCYYKSYPLYDCDIAKYTITDYSQLTVLLELQ